MTCSLLITSHSPPLTVWAIRSMPLTALSEFEIIDATACRDGAWSMIYRFARDPKLLCRGCQQPVHAKISSRTASSPTIVPGRPVRATVRRRNTDI